MDYSKLIIEIEKQVFDDLKMIFIEICNSQPIETSYSRLIPLLDKTIKNDAESIKENLDEFNLNLINVYSESSSKYDGKDYYEICKYVLIYDIQPMLKNFDNSKQADVIHRLIKYDLMHRASIKMKNECDYLDLVRKSKKYDYFKYKDEDGYSMKDTKEFSDLYKIVNKRTWKSGSYYRSKNQPILNLKEREFTDIEVLVLRGVFFKILDKAYNHKERNMPFSKNDFNKMISILGKLEKEIDLFGKADSSQTSYKRFSDLYNNLKGNSRENRMEILLSKVEKFNILPLNNALKIYKKTGKI
ncbi:hypothetical protein CLV86_2836 [Lacinutrix venerupis]|uniref:hypothetical protein n=1 Tax=Lacinutrix venerupis TaxID=1486034 RepID=UPI000EAD9191|nr:hypothetical protein [Lacinutrix venerupis]RLJ60775.1 hypothetical protein CLV86_2836 [Lacinutrix venerupis]